MVLVLVVLSGLGYGGFKGWNYYQHLTKTLNEKNEQIAGVCNEKLEIAIEKETLASRLNQKEKEILNKQGKAQVLQTKLSALSSDYQALALNLEGLKQERERLAAKLQETLGEKNKVEEENLKTKATINDLTKQKAEIEESQKQTLTLTNQLKQEKEAVAKAKELVEQKLNLTEEIKQFYKSELEKKEAKKQPLENEEAVSKNSSKAGKEVKNLKKETAKLEKAQKDLNQAKDTLKKTEKELAETRKRYNDLLTRHSKITAEKITLEKEKEVLEAKKGIKQVSDAKLLKETADTHYNVGLFYLKGGEYSKAVKEFKRTIELVPNDANVCYYLGYIYAEQLKEPKTAVGYLEEYLRLEPKGEHADYAKKYIITIKATNIK